MATETVEKTDGKDVRQRKPMTELRAMAVVENTLKQLSPQAARRVVSWSADKLSELHPRELHPRAWDKEAAGHGVSNSAYASDGSYTGRSS